MVRKLMLVGIIAVLVLAVAAPALAKRGGEGGRGDGPTVYVTGQHLFYDSIVVADPVPNKGPFQELINVGTMANPELQTEFGPGDQGYVGGRWFIDTDGVEGRSDGDTFFICPLLGPGYEA
jgi:hypothetical protein